jgi:cysteine desulfurase/selenocysteine lyase
METTTAAAAQPAPETASPPLPLEEIRGQFPLLAREQNGKPLAYLDNGATSQKPLAMIEALDRYWREQNANVHRGVYRLSEEATELYEGARRVLAARLGADRREVVFVRNATEALNLVAYSWGRPNVGDGDRILLTEMEHHSNIVPWYQLAQEKGAKLDWAPITDSGTLDLEAFRALLERHPRVVAVAHISNVLGTINPIAEVARLAHEAGAVVVVDGAQAGPKLPLRMADLGADFYALTSHKMYGPTGIGALFGRRELLEEMPPFIGGGSMIHRVQRDVISWADLPAKFEGGTPAIGEAIGYAAAVEWLDAVGLDAAHAHEAELTSYALQRLAEVPGLRLFGPPPGEDRAGIISFALDEVHAHDVSEILDRHAVCARAGHHCAQILMERLGVTATTRASFAVYNTHQEVDRLVDALHDVRRVFELD